MKRVIRDAAAGAAAIYIVETTRPDTATATATALMAFQHERLQQEARAAHHNANGY
jgi:hypothetical protein